MNNESTTEGTLKAMKTILDAIPSQHCAHCYQNINSGEEAKHENGKCNEICVKCGYPVHPCTPCGEVVQYNNHVDSEYFRLLNLILKEGTWTENRTGVDTCAVFGAQAKFDVDLDAFPILTTKKVWFKGILHELLWFLKGDTNIKYLVDNDVHIWDEWAYARYKKAFNNVVLSSEDMVYPQNNQECFIKRIKEDAAFAAKWGELGEGTYGGMWRAFPYWTVGANEERSNYTETGTVDQFQKVIDKLKNNPTDRRMIVSAWHPYWVDHCALPPCHCLFHFNTRLLNLEERRNWGNKHTPQASYCFTYSHQELDNIGVPRRQLNLLLYQRSCDSFLGVPFNITSYCLMLAMVAHVSNMVPGIFTHTYGDLHIYRNHVEQVKLQMTRTPKALPKLWLNPSVKNLFDFKYEDVKLIGYESHPTIKAEVAV